MCSLCKEMQKELFRDLLLILFFKRHLISFRLKNADLIENFQLKKMCFKEIKSKFS